MPFAKENRAFSPNAKKNEIAIIIMPKTSPQPINAGSGVWGINPSHTHTHPMIM